MKVRELRFLQCGHSDTHPHLKSIFSPDMRLMCLNRRLKECRTSGQDVASAHHHGSSLFYKVIRQVVRTTWKILLGDSFLCRLTAAFRLFLLLAWDSRALWSFLSSGSQKEGSKYLLEYVHFCQVITLEIPLRIGSFLPSGYIRAVNSRTFRKGTMALEHIGSNLAIAT